MTDTPTSRTCCTSGTCFSCRYWKERVQWAENGDMMPATGRHAAAPIARVNGRHYVVKPMDTTSPSQFLGFGGALWTFRFNDGRTVTSNDVMTQGEIPAHFLGRLPDNAVIVPQVAPTPTISFAEFEGLL